jgi:hypothetical protein
MVAKAGFDPPGDVRAERPASLGCLVLLIGDWAMEASAAWSPRNAHAAGRGRVFGFG